MNKLDLFKIDGNYIDYLRNFDSRVPINKDSYIGRPYIGVVFSINEFNYFAPLTSPKRGKTIRYNNQITTHIFQEPGKKCWENYLGAILHNNMIPVPNEVLEKIDIEIEKDRDFPYGNLLQKQYEFITNYNSQILKKSLDTYNKQTLGNSKLHQSVCCNYKALELACSEYQLYFSNNYSYEDEW
ncbi:type III toxin-antitoxin system ToxN/AbiQ family toxin [Aerococcus mictus]|uniref:type III toxin-antitoxin system ToxN/AbiQ family toxin n=1 Tax=Aerococcus mictus TaxID=2976810 RepID=UPI0018A76534|nr:MULTISPECIES: type III toxin-antitoxin system ToxN/AbiQ family toxin [Lactobacillales]MCY3067575.1 type III toxin-antitoxin system ToxN/AbiQ family toxin [Aerococcus mictus]MCY3080890.1 type III toxin-antitoxin system ToxN/AbiQ family toxin [Aerococcus mictus]MDK8607496.1 type III toxin-antitoxin system ToxN/AbiQ family toxin [Lactobacillus paragasseri]